MTQITLSEPVKTYIKTQVSHEVEKYLSGKKVQKAIKTLYRLPLNVEKMYIRDEIEFYRKEKKHTQKPSYNAKELIQNIEDEAD
ncbi:MAG: hypothetical protein UU81_C0050G0008 [Microgenomates group bacterium GW2011_GWC1_41_8]|uniref:Uncharacterized protein n=2 Tax=Candidatus Roizmaniibacteriota TaxID=1752723 RepID=A0A0G0X9K3_9BACT|nr:MAG: hypothetical protein UT85_C0003G0017 [Candidatus Levybacteria bacterium GW2011_GWA2_40_16]KKR72028.1 MAG: hypothetical protein UU14_C0013G0002 [Candidatus Roizmanbacteria bacterium GW2011_GWB1_40_7]KKS21072.1 MAG: hypothetical protein UU78_C0044G0002 [Candidatus Roizmanbacteria bacterium GW2011_GWC2_41_7]KKS22672.1 MAG: hypothetical protein UU81_C0050G0008 [Microgenomates group bacterium GW2011_GWC1_41_8]OGK49845.1 MAG: hypothetical protein A3A55_02020 [Candidatus Roizmanbacteria bacter